MKIKSTSSILKNEKTHVKLQKDMCLKNSVSHFLLPLHCCWLHDHEYMYPINMTSCTPDKSGFVWPFCPHVLCTSITKSADFPALFNIKYLFVALVHCLPGLLYPNKCFPCWTYLHSESSERISWRNYNFLDHWVNVISYNIMVRLFL